MVTFGSPVPPATANGVGPVFASIGPIAFDGGGTLFAGDVQNAAIFALDLAGTPKGAPGAADVEGLDQRSQR